MHLTTLSTLLALALLFPLGLCIPCSLEDGQCLTRPDLTPRPVVQVADSKAEHEPVFLELPAAKRSHSDDGNGWEAADRIQQNTPAVAGTENNGVAPRDMTRISTSPTENNVPQTKSSLISFGDDQGPPPAQEESAFFSFINVNATNTIPSLGGATNSDIKIDGVNIKERRGSQPDITAERPFKPAAESATSPRDLDVTKRETLLPAHAGTGVPAVISDNGRADTR
ncbi:MAG: hypothetical protein M1838_003293 [Thelocarpon superellum]|nr:MAG: hypothetical protein M1838_003293 [Thelocarpon superellum]